MGKTDKQLGLHRDITRRDTLASAAAAGIGAFMPTFTSAAITSSSQPHQATYPPAETGMRGNHPGSFDVAHQLGRQGRTDWGQVSRPEQEIYDLVVVGAGLSGLAAAYFFWQKNPDARILILDNHDDFGGHARRNEFYVGGRTLIGYGGSQTLQEPSSYSRVVKRLLRDLDVNLKAFESAYDTSFYNRHDLKGGIFFNEEKWGVNRTIPFNIGYFNDYIPVAPSTMNAKEAVAEMPVSDPAKAELVRLFTSENDQLPNLNEDEKWERLASISYRTFLEEHMNIKEPEVFDVFQGLTGDAGAGIEAITAATALYYNGLPGWDATGLPKAEPSEPYIHHFPDGNASIARLMIRAMIPSVADTSDMQEMLTAAFDYGQLDVPDSSIRVRLNSTVVNVAHENASTSAQSTDVTYVRNGAAYQVSSKACILACQHSMIPHLCPELPEEQKSALSYQERAPILYTSVATTNWRAWKELGVGAVVAPGSYYIDAQIDFPVSFKGYEYSPSPDDPVIVHMERFPFTPDSGLSIREQHQIGRYELLSTPFDVIERNTRAQLAGILGDAGFDPIEDIEAITVNRWAHGYSYYYSPLHDDMYDDWEDERYPHMIARKRHGRIAIANTDSAANAMFESAVDEAYRAVTELSEV